MTTRAEAGVGPGRGGPGPTDELPAPHEETSRARRIAAAGKRNGNLTRQLRRVAIKLVHRTRQVARRMVSPHGIVLSLIRGCGQIGKTEPLVVVTTTWVFEALVPSRVTDGGVTVQEVPAGRPAQLNTTR